MFKITIILAGLFIINPTFAEKKLSRFEKSQSNALQKLTHKISTLQIEKKCTKKATNYPSFKNCRKKTVKANKLFKKKLRAEKAAKKAKKSHKN